ncbi:MAG: c-type cytochrome [Acidobacteria bacterium]|nr:c-type cytochrome [Acidobacteriota bacterium]
MYLPALIAAAGLAAGADAKVKLPKHRTDIARGEKLYTNHCVLCHGADGGGGRGPALAQPKLPRAPDDGALVKVIEEGIGGTEMPGAWQMSPREIRQVAAYVRTLGRVASQPVPGDASRGRVVYQGKAGCASCHSIKGEGGVSGPDLAGVGARRSAAYLRASLIDPETEVPEGYLVVKLSLKDGSSLTGVRVNEDSFSIQVRDSRGRSHSFWKRELAGIDKQRGTSPMPSYKSQLTEAELTDLIAFLASLKEAS